MISHAQFAVTAVLTVCVYYSIAWYLFGRDPKLGTLVPRYDPPRNLSPAMLRYLWKKNFDERVFWAGILSLVAKGVATLHSENGVTKLQGRSAGAQTDLPNEERVLQSETGPWPPSQGCHDQHARFEHDASPDRYGEFTPS